MFPLIKAENVNKSFVEDGHKRHVLKDIDLEVTKGEFVMILGLSGSGKSTLLRILANLIPPSNGKVSLKEGLTMSFIFQNFALFPWLNIYDNIDFGLKMKGLSLKDRHKEVTSQIERMGLQGFEHSFPRELSGGMKQRVGIARALAVKPDVIFLDEPFSALDSFTATKLRQELLQIWQEQNLTLVMVTHLIEEALLLADRIAVLSQRPAVIEKMMDNPLPRPRNKRSQQFFEMEDKIAGLIKV